MTSTASEKLYLNDSLRLNFTAHIHSQSQWHGRPSVLLDRSAFYPEGGGQPGDHGRLIHDSGEFQVMDVQIAEDGSIHHVLEGDASGVLKPGDAISGQIDEKRRRDYMSQHTGQHMLSAMIDQTLDMPTISARLGSKSGTIDVEGDSAIFTPTQIRTIEDAVNHLVLKDLPIEVLYPNSEELATLGLRRAPKVVNNIRIIKVGGFDCTPCGGTHCHRTGQVGPVKIVAAERYKGLTRLSFLAGTRAIDYLSEQAALLNGLAASVGCAAAELQGHFDRLREELKAQSQELGIFRAQVIRNEATALLEQWEDAAEPRILIREREDLKTSRQLAALLSQREDILVLIASREEADQDWRLILTRGEQRAFDCGAWFRNTGKAAGARGGGKPNRAEGRLGGDADPQALTLL